MQVRLWHVLALFFVASLMLAAFIEHESDLESISIETADGLYALDVATVKHSSLFSTRSSVRASIKSLADQQFICGYESKIGHPYTHSNIPVSLQPNSPNLPRWISHPSLPGAVYAIYWLTEDDAMEIGVLPTATGHQALGSW